MASLRLRRPASGGSAIALLLGSALSFGGCHHRSPTEPGEPAHTTMSGSWHGSADRGPCGTSSSAEDWSHITATLSQAGESVSGHVAASGGARHPVVGTFSAGQLILGVNDLPNTSTCYSFALTSTALTHDARGNLTAVSGFLQGRCCGTVAGSFRLTRDGSR